jgi:hypothetical protein
MSNSKLDDVFGLLYDELKRRVDSQEIRKLYTPALIIQITNILKLKEVMRQSTKGKEKKKKTVEGVNVFKSFRGQK